MTLTRSDVALLTDVCVMNPPKPTIKHDIKKITKKTIGLWTRLLSTIVACYPIRRFYDCMTPTSYIELDLLPNEVVLRIISFCDFSTKMNMRAVNHRLHALVDECAHVLERRNLVGGVEIGSGGRPDSSIQLVVKDDEDAGSLSSSVSSLTSYDPQLTLTLRRPLKRMEILLPATRLTNIMRHVCVCHSLKLCGVSLDEALASDILDASFRAISDLIIDRVHSVTSDTLNDLVRKVYPSNSLHIYNHNTPESTDAILPDMLSFCPARDIAIQSSITLMHGLFDDAALVKLVLSDVTVRRSIRLPHCAITHWGINDAAKAFHERCCELIMEMTAEMHCPLWQVVVSLPRSNLIDRSCIRIPSEMKEQCAIWGHLPPQRDSFTVEVRVEQMNLRIMVEAS